MTIPQGEGYVWGRTVVTPENAEVTWNTDELGAAGFTMENFSPQEAGVREWIVTGPSLPGETVDAVASINVSGTVYSATLTITTQEDEPEPETPSVRITNASGQDITSLEVSETGENPGFMRVNVVPAEASITWNTDELEAAQIELQEDGEQLDGHQDYTVYGAQAGDYVDAVASITVDGTTYSDTIRITVTE